MDEIRDMECMKDDESASEANTFQMNIRNLSIFRESCGSFCKPHNVHGFKWEMRAFMRTRRHDKENFLAFYLHCFDADGDFISIWNCPVSAKFRLLSFNKDTPPLTQEITHNFSNDDNVCGFGTFIKFSEMLDPEKEYVRDDSITLEVSIDKIDRIKNSGTIQLDHDEPLTTSSDDLRQELSEVKKTLKEREDTLREVIEASKEVLKAKKKDMVEYQMSFDLKDKRIAELEKKIAEMEDDKKTPENSNEKEWVVVDYPISLSNEEA